MSDILIYDIALDEMRPATQKDVDDLWRFAQEVGHAALKRQEVVDKEPGGEDFSFKLAAFSNPMRDDGLFVAEDKEIEPYDGVTNLDGSARYPAIPKTKWTLRGQLQPEFARELVRRWNAA